MSALQVLARVRGERYALPVGGVSEVARLGALTPVPGAPAAVLGVFSLRGEVVPVLDLGVVLGLGPVDGGWVVIAEDGSRRGGLAVDEVLDVTALPDAIEQADPPLLGSADFDGDVFGIVDVGATFDAVGR